MLKGVNNKDMLTIVDGVGHLVQRAAVAFVPLEVLGHTHAVGLVVVGESRECAVFDRTLTFRKR
jgi:hypothetical protein